MNVSIVLYFWHIVAKGNYREAGERLGDFLLWYLQIEFHRQRDVIRC